MRVWTNIDSLSKIMLSMSWNNLKSMTILLKLIVIVLGCTLMSQHMEAAAALNILTEHKNFPRRNCAKRH